ncbi:MAG TPA: hypothetical protein VGB53_03700 [Rubricoccaceae bacterium]
MTSDVPLRPLASPPVVAVVGEAHEAVRALGAAGVHVRSAGAEIAAEEPARVVVVAGPVEGRAAAVRAAVAAGQHAFVAWPPGALAEAEALVRDAEEAGVEVGVEQPLAWPGMDGPPVRLVAATIVMDGSAWRRRLAGALDVCTARVGRREAVRVSAVAERDGARLQAVATTVRYQNGALAHVLVRAGRAEAGAGVAVYAAGAEASADAKDAFADEAVAFVQAVAARRPCAYPLHHALATLRLAERVAAAMR